jgi:hypothetical protein
MDRPTHRRPIFLGLALLACGALLLLAWRWTSTADTTPANTAASTSQLATPQPVDVEPPPPIEAAAPSVAQPSSPPLTGFHGQVIDAASRQPVKEFEVQLIRLRKGGYAEDEPVTKNFKSATGRFTWTDAAAGSYRAAVSAAGYQMFNVVLFQISNDEVTRVTVIPLLRGFAVRGRVFDSSNGAGIVDARITWRSGNDRDRFRRSMAQAKSKADGAFTLDGLPRGDIVLIVGARDHANRELRLLVDEKTPPQEITLSSGGKVSGTVTTTSGAPVKGQIRLEGPGPSYISETNEAGQFSFANRSAGSYRVSADTSAGSAAEEFELREDESKEGITLIVGAGGGRSVRGMVKGWPAARMQYMTIMLRSASEGTMVSARPDERGAYVLNGVPAGHAAVSVISASIQLEKQVDVPADKDVTLDIIIPSGARLTGRVTQGGKPAANKNVWMSPADTKAGVRYRARTSEDGQYQIESLAPGDYRVRADEDISRSITIAGEAVLNIDISGPQLSARVMEEGGTVPVVGASVYVRGTAPETARVRSDKETDDFGAVALTALEPGELVLLVYKTGYELHRETITYSTPISDKTITLRKSPGVEVRVKPDSRRFPRGFTLTQSFPGNDYVVDMWMPLDSDNKCHVPGALKGTTFKIGRFSGEPLVFEDWDGQSFELP